MYLAIKYQYTLYTLDASNSISFKTFLPKKKKYFACILYANDATFYKYQWNDYSKRFHGDNVQILSVFMFLNWKILNFCYRLSETDSSLIL